MYIRRFTYKREDVDCKFCTEYQGEKECPHTICLYLTERIEAGAVTYQDAVHALIHPGYQLIRRLPQLLLKYQDFFWENDQHKSRMEFFNTRMGYVPSRNTPAYYAAMYLLTANEAIHYRTANCFCHAGMDFSFAILKGISPHNYVLYRAAVGLCTSERGVTFAEMADRELVDDEAFGLIINALLIARYGTAAMKLRKEMPSHDQ